MKDIIQAPEYFITRFADRIYQSIRKTVNIIRHLFFKIYRS